MADFIENGEIILSTEEIKKLEFLAAKVEALRWQHDTLVAINHHLVLINEAFMEENKKLKNQLLIDQHFQICKIEHEQNIINL